jgi:hypothetical protein
MFHASLHASRPLTPFALALALALLPACDRLKELGGGGTSGSGAPGAAASSGPSVSIPAGVLRAGSPCGAIPRITNEELVGTSISIGSFSIDTYPYPNDPTKPARVDVTRDEAEALCGEQGKRLCTELEWEYACKGPSNTTFEYGPGYDANACKTEADAMPGRRAKCGSAFGVKDLHGLVFEWTRSAWGRGTSGDLGTVRGGPGGVLQARCANGQSRPTGTRAKDLGFRCCAGKADPAVVDLTLHHEVPLTEEPSVEPSLGAAMLRAMPAEHRAVTGADVAFEKLWRWHPRDNEELLVGRWTARPRDGGAPSHLLAIFKVCGGVPGLVAHMRGAVGEVDAPGSGADAQKIGARVLTNRDTGELRLTYGYGSVQIEHPEWIRTGAVVIPADKAAARPTIPQPKTPLIQRRK